MASAKCLENIRSEPPPYNVACTDPFCYKTSFARGVHCSTRGLPMDTPVLSWDPDLGGGQACYCCCSCFAMDTPIEARPGEFMMIQDIQAGDTIMAAGRDLEWKETRVRLRTGDLNPSMVPGLYCVYYLLEEESESRFVLVTPDHLFLMNTTRTLKKVQHLIPGDKLTAKDGRVAQVQFVALGEHNTSIQSIEMEGRLDPETLEGHLINSNGIVTADYVVQVYHETSTIDDKHIYRFSDPDDVQEAGTDEYAAKFHCQELENFLNDEKSWPRGFVPRRQNLVNVPRFAQGFLTDQQAQDVWDNGEFNAYTNVVGRDNVERLFKFSRSQFPGITCILDWHNKVPNAYAWNQNNQKILLVTGGLVRLKSLFLEGQSLIIAFLQAYLEGNRCIGNADYEAVENLRDLWPDSMLAQLLPSAIAQVQAMFDLVDAKHAGGNPEDVCAEPSLKCRIKTYWNAFSFFGIPDCALPKSEYFDLLRAYADIDNTRVSVVFSDGVEKDSGTDTENYQFIPVVKVTKAEIDPANNRIVILEVDGLKGAGKYMLTVGEVKSVHGARLTPGADTVIVKTP